MTLEEARKIAEIAETVDGGCYYCVGNVCEKLREAFPEFEWRFDVGAERVYVEPREAT